MKPWLACPICKRLAPGRALCGHCAEALYLRREPQWRECQGYSISSLFSWQRDGWLALRWWVANIKQKEDPRFWREAALWAWDEFKRPDRGAVLVPVPTAQGPNHALGFARAIGAWSGLPISDCLAIKGEPGFRLAQKRQSRASRHRRRFQVIHQEPPFCINSTAVIIVDDIVTTGATAEAAYRALGGPRNCQVWCLLDRGLSPLAVK